MTSELKVFENPVCLVVPGNRCQNFEYYECWDVCPHIGGRCYVLEALYLRFADALFDETIFEAILPFKDAWRDGYIDTPLDFASQSLFERAFSELFFCKRMSVDVSFDGQLSQPCLSFPAVRECVSLEIDGYPSPLTAAEIIEWLNADGYSKGPKRLEMIEYDLNDGVEHLVQELKTVCAGNIKNEARRKRIIRGRTKRRPLSRPDSCRIH